MDYRPLGRTGVQVSALCLGTMMFGTKTTPDDSFPIIDRALDAGVNFLDTANMYGRGASERVIGEALRRNGRRGRVVLATKVYQRMDEADPNAFGLSRRHIIAECEQSLRRLQTDYIDLYQVHRPMSSIPIDETLRALDDLVRSGKVRYIGTSTFAAWQIMESLWASKELGLNRFVTEQPPYHLLDRRIERELVPMAVTYGIALLPWSPLAGGMLTGKYKRGESPPSDARFGDPNYPLRFRYTQQSFDRIEPLEALARDKGAALSQLALAWVLGQPGVTSPIIGPRTMEQLEDNLSALAVSLTEEDRRRIDAIAPPGTSTAPFYEADHGPSRYRW